MTPDPLDHITFDWGVRCFGKEHMNNLQIRALRMLEEAMEFCQAAQVDPRVVQKSVDTVFSRPVGNMEQEMGGLILTTRMICFIMGWDPKEIYLREIRRCLSKRPEEFTKRNEEKLKLGLGT